ncbi:hypothetical protein MM221_14595 [Salipaludibacillus sp. LMS25]|jgi:hypothetical protein|uniref:hypothetical protein n=1 Tax=Salipaludibacillus sp. LMS25 TaxID=2924031 RepID=UPI0020D17F16|nr:hypothetical protein [Salipaludibacillus sp. LMS25]UTR13831.1 hypothetical protein MM221_14595 [Salipaludibacillus sp. LMS25]
MTGKGKFVLSILVLGIVIAGGVFAYSLTTSPEVKLAKAFENLLEEEVIQIDSDFSVAYDFDLTPEDMHFHGEEAVYFDIFKDVMENITGTSSVIIDRENKVIEAGVNYGVSGDIQGSPISLQIPFQFYMDEEADEIALDLDPYVDFSGDLIETAAHHIIPHIPEAEETLALLNDGTYSAEWATEEFTDVITPIAEDMFSGKKITHPLDMQNPLFESEVSEETAELSLFMFMTMFDYLSAEDESFLTEEDGWIYLSSDFGSFYEALIYSLKEVKNDDDMLRLYDDILYYYSNEKIDDIKEKLAEDIEEMEEELDDIKEGLNGDFTVGFNIKDGVITSITQEAELQMNPSVFDEKDPMLDDVTMSATVSTTNHLAYGEDAEFSFYGQDRDEFDEEEAQSLIEKHVERFMMENYEMFEALMAPEVTPASPDQNDDTSYQDYELTDDDLALFAAIEAGEITAEDAEMDETEFYLEVLALEAEGLVAPGTADQYLP